MRLANGEVLLGWPLAAHVVTAGYYYNGGGAHGAIDLRTAGGGTTVQPVLAAEDGTVDWVQDWDGCTTTGLQSYGTAVRLRHGAYRGKTLQTRYAHLSLRCVDKGQTVRAGQVIGYSGQTGRCYGAHLHFEVIWNGVRRNPLVWLDGDFSTASKAVYTYGKNEGPVCRPRLVTLRIGPASAGDADRLRALAEQLGLGCELMEG